MKIKNDKMILNAWKFVYLFAAVVLPSIGAALLLSVSGFSGGGIIGEYSLRLLLILSVVSQTLFIFVSCGSIRKQVMDSKFIKNEIIFLLFMVLILAPLMFAFSTTFVNAFDEIFETIDTVSIEGANVQSPVIISGCLSVTPDFFRTYSILNLIILSLFAGLFSGTLFMDKIRVTGGLRVFLYVFGPLAAGAVLAVISAGMFAAFIPLCKILLSPLI